MPQALGNLIITLALATGTAGLLPAASAFAIGSAVLSTALSVGTQAGGNVIQGPAR